MGKTSVYDMAGTKIKGVSIETNRHGKRVVYYRKPIILPNGNRSTKKIRLPDNTESRQFLTALSNAKHGIEAKPPLLRKVAIENTLRWTCEKYYQSAHFLELAPSGQVVRISETLTICKFVYRI